MPPKKRAAATKSKVKAPAGKKPATPVASSSAAKAAGSADVSLPAQKSTPGTSASSGTKRAADSSELNSAQANKKAKVTTAEDDNSDSDSDESFERIYESLSQEDKDKILGLGWKLKDRAHNPYTIRKMFEGIKCQKTFKEDATLRAMTDALELELMKRCASGKQIEDELAIIHDVDKKWWDGVYDDELPDEDGLPKDVRKRLDDAERMLQFMAGGALKTILRQLNPWAHGGTNADMRDTILATLDHLAKDGKNIKREYMIVKSFGMSCGNDSDPDLNCQSDAYEEDEDEY